MIIHVPTYLNRRTLPLVSDLLYHSKVFYFLPTGTHPLEFRNVLRFPRYCTSKSIELPALVWEMCELYFVNTKEAAYCAEILQPLIGSNILVVTPIYPRDRAAIEKAKQLIENHPSLSNALASVELDPKFLAREFLSHILFEIYLENGINGSIKYIYENSRTETEFHLLISSILINRLTSLVTLDYPILLYEHSWITLLQEHAKLSAPHSKNPANNQNENDSFEIEHFRFKLFETLLMPLYGRCDSKEKADVVAKLIEQKQHEIIFLKGECGHIAREVMLLPTKDIKIQQDVLREAIQRRITEPLISLLDKPRQETLTFLRDFVLDSSVIAGLLSMFYSSDTKNLATAFASAAISAGVRFVLSYQARQHVKAPKLLIEGMRKNRVSYLQLQAHLSNINMSQLTIPKELR